MDRSDRHDDTAEVLAHTTERRSTADADAARRSAEGGSAATAEEGAPEASASVREPGAERGVARDRAARAGDANTGESDTGDGDAEDLEEEEEATEEEAELRALSEEPVDEPEGEAPPAVSRKVRRRARRTRPRSRTIALKRLTREELRSGAAMNPPVEEPRPQTRAECKEDVRPCPWVACRHHLYLDVNPDTGSIKINFPDLEPWEIGETCALDIADRGGITLEEVGEIMNLTRERIRQVEVRGLSKLKALSPSPDDLGGNIEPGER